MLSAGERMNSFEVLSFGVSLAMMFVLFVDQPAPARRLPLRGYASLVRHGPGYELQVSDAIYAFNAPEVNSLPTRPRGGPREVLHAYMGNLCEYRHTLQRAKASGLATSIGSTTTSRAPTATVGYGAEVTGFGNTNTCNQISTVISDTPVVGVASAPCALLTAADGGVFAFCGAPFYGSMGGKPLNKPMVGIASTPDGRAIGSLLLTAESSVSAMQDSTARWVEIP